jgi:hypothetical protein
MKKHNDRGLSAAAIGGDRTVSRSTVLKVLAGSG